MGFKKKYEDKIYGVTTLLDFGKYEGRSIGDIAEADPQYLLWACKSVQGFVLSQAVYKTVKENVVQTNDMLDDNHFYGEQDYLWK